MSFFENFQHLCEEKGVKPTTVVVELGLARGAVTKWKNGTMPNKTTLPKLADYFGVTPGYFYQDNPKEKDPNNIYPVDGLVFFEEIGAVKAGFGGTAEEILTGKRVELPISMLAGKNKSDYFLLRVSGDSMYPALIDGDNILCERCTSVDSGSIAVVLYNNEEATVKKVRYVYGEDWLELIPINPMYTTKRIEGADLEQCRVLGKVIKLIRNF